MYLKTPSLGPPLFYKRQETEEGQHSRDTLQWPFKTHSYIKQFSESRCEFSSGPNRVLSTKEELKQGEPQHAEAQNQGLDPGVELPLAPSQKRQLTLTAV